MNNMLTKNELKMISTLALDVDGVLTDGTFWWGGNGEELKRFSFVDIMGLSIWRKKGFRTVLISGENGPLIDRYADKMSIDKVYKGAKNKAACIEEILKKYSINKNELCFIGDDINDIPAFEAVGFSVAVRNANPKVFPYVRYQTINTGGLGAVREIVDMILAAKLDA